MAVPHDLRHLDAPTLADQAYETVREAIMRGDLVAGERLTDRGLASSMAVSPTPVREALRRLEQDRLVERTGPRTVRVANHPPRALGEITLLTGTLQSVAARLAAGNASADELSAVADKLGEADRLKAELYDQAAQTSVDDEDVYRLADRLIVTLREFHELISRGCHNDVLLHMLRTCEAFGLAHRQRSLREDLRTRGHGPAQRYGQHRAILEALQARDADRVGELMLEHSRVASDDLMRH